MNMYIKLLRKQTNSHSQKETNSSRYGDVDVFGLQYGKSNVNG